MKLGEHFKIARKRLGLSQAELGILLGKNNHVTVSQIENGKSNPTLETLLKLFQIPEMKQAFDNFVTENVKIKTRIITWQDKK